MEPIIGHWNPRFDGLFCCEDRCIMATLPKILGKTYNASCFSDSYCIAGDQKTYQIQLFEFLVVEALARLDPAIKWTITRSSGDNGVDFYGVGPTYTIPKIGVSISNNMYGQIKFRSGTLEPSSLHSDFAKIGRLTEENKITRVIFILVCDKLNLNTFEKFWSDPYNASHFHGDKYFLDGTPFIAYWKRNQGIINRIVKNCLSESENTGLIQYFEKIHYNFQDECQVKCRVPNKANTGHVFKVELDINYLSALPNETINIRYLHPIGVAPIMEILRPSNLVGNDGIVLKVSLQSPLKFKFHMRCFIMGEHPVGTILVYNGIGELLQQVNLGTITLIHTFQPVFYSKPVSSLKKIVEEKIIDSSTNSKFYAIIVTGHGGIGKSAFCQACLDYAADEGFEWGSIGHGDAFGEEDGILKQLLLSLAKKEDDEIASIDSILRSIDNSITNDKCKLISATKSLFCSSHVDIDAEAIVKVLTILILSALNHSPLILHLHDLHWAGKILFTILSDLIVLLKASSASLPNGLIFILEGRSRENVFSRDNYYFPKDWIDFIQRVPAEKIELKSWDDKWTENFVEDIILKKINPNDTTLAQNIPMHQELVKGIMCYSSGNPMHIIEQFKLLFDKEIVCLSANGYLYVKNYHPSSWLELRDKNGNNKLFPQSVQDTIQARISHYKENNKLLIELLAVVGKIGRFIPSRLFWFLVQSVPGGFSEQAFIALDVGSLPGPNTTNFSFRHENYYEQFNKYQLPETCVLIEAALNWLESQDHIDSDSYLSITKLYIISSINKRLQAACKAGNLARQGFLKYHRDNMILESLQALLKIPDDYLKLESLNRSNLIYQLAMVLARTGNWEETCRVLENLALDGVGHPLDSYEGFNYLLAKAELGNIYLSLQRCGDSLRAVAEVLPLVESHLNNNEGNIDYSLNLVENEITNEFLTDLTPNNITYRLIREKLMHRRAVALWFNGEMVSGGRWQWKAFLSARKAGDLLGMSVALREFGTLMLHRNPLKGCNILEKSLSLAKSIQKLHHITLLLTDIQLQMGYILLAEDLGSTFSRIAFILEKTTILYSQARNTHCIYETSIAGLNCAAMEAIRGNFEEARLWYQSVITTTTLGGLQDELWKAQIGLAQVCRILDAPGESITHARDAYNLIVKGLQVGTTRERAQRCALMTLPLLQVFRHNGCSKMELEKLLNRSIERDLENWNERKKFRSNRGEQQQVLHLRNKDNDWFLMN